MNATDSAQISQKANQPAIVKARHDAEVEQAMGLATEIIDMEARNGNFKTRTSIGYPYDISIAAQREAIGILKDLGYRVWDHSGGTIMVGW